jgi:IS30 family transposase
MKLANTSSTEETMPYQHDTPEERDALGVMLGMKLPKTYISVILGKHLSSIYHELNRNSDENGIYLGREAQDEADQRRANTKERPKMSNDDL